MKQTQTVYKKIASITTVATLLLSSFAPLLSTLVFASDFDVQIARDFTVDETRGLIHITEKRTLSNNTQGFFIPSSATEVFALQDFREGFDVNEYDIKRNSIKVTDGYGSSITYSTRDEGNDIIVEANYPRNVNPGTSVTIQLEYDTPELLQKIGSVTNIHIPGLDESYEEYTTDPDNGVTSRMRYTTTLEVPSTMPAASFTLPAPSSEDVTASATIYTFVTEDIIGTSVWHQIGSTQTYAFSINQPIPQSDSFTPSQLSFLSRSQYNLILPRDYEETNQDVFYTDISPLPDEIYIDDNGNVIATFFIDTTSASEINVEGYITVELPESDEDVSLAASKTLSDIDSNAMSESLGPSEYWESDDPRIIEKAEELASGSTLILDILTADYEFIVDAIDYDDFKFGERNTRKGAIETLEGGSSVCMEYSDLLIALARAQGIPARAAYGYGYDPKFSPDQQEEHQWVQAWIPDYGWLTIDPTWGETGREFIGRDLDHALWYVASEHPNEPSPLEVISVNTTFEIEQSAIEFAATEGIPDDIELMTVDELVGEIGTDTSRTSQILRTIQTTLIGRSLVVLLPLCTGVIFLTTIISTITRAIRKTQKKQDPDSH